jgi:hypothetical protein
MKILCLALVLGFAMIGGTVVASMPSGTPVHVTFHCEPNANGLR